jgi:hypothetical protein
MVCIERVKVLKTYRVKKGWTILAIPCSLVQELRNHKWDKFAYGEKRIERVELSVLSKRFKIYGVKKGLTILPIPCNLVQELRNQKRR